MNFSVRPKKHLGQHFLIDENIAKEIADSLKNVEKYKTIVEIGPGTGVLTKYLIQLEKHELFLVEIDRESIHFLEVHFPGIKKNIISADFLKLKLSDYFDQNFAVIGNFPYNISSQILFRILEYRNQIPEAVGMFQKEVAMRIASKSGNKVYGILSVLTQAFYNIEYLFTVNEDAFFPSPKVKSAVVRLVRNDVEKLNCNEVLFFKIVKLSFNQRRKILKNTLKHLTFKDECKNHEYFSKRAEQLNVIDFVELTNMLIQ